MSRRAALWLLVAVIAVVALSRCFYNATTDLVEKVQVHR